MGPTGYVAFDGQGQQIRGGPIPRGAVGPRGGGARGRGGLLTSSGSNPIVANPGGVETPEAVSPPVTAEATSLASFGPGRGGSPAARGGHIPGAQSTGQTGGGPGMGPGAARGGVFSGPGLAMGPGTGMGPGAARGGVGSGPARGRGGPGPQGGPGRGRGGPGMGQGRGRGGLVQGQGLQQEEDINEYFEQTEEQEQDASPEAVEEPAVVEDVAPSAPGVSVDVQAKQQEQREAKERQLRAQKQQRQRQLTSLICSNTYTVEDLCAAAWNGGDIDKFLEILHFLSVDEINKTNSRGQTALVSFYGIQSLTLISTVLPGRVS